MNREIQQRLQWVKLYVLLRFILILLLYIINVGNEWISMNTDISNSK